MWLGLLLSASSALALTCPRVECGVTPAGTCASVSGGSLLVSNCTGEYTCYVADLMSIWPTEGASLKCASKPRTTFSIAEEHLTIFRKRMCSLGIDGKKLVGEHPKQCFSDTDCALQDNTYGFCVCGLDSKAYCQYEKGDTAYGQLISASCDEDVEQMLASMTMIQLYPLYNSLPSCATGYFGDVATINLVTTWGDAIEFELINIEAAEVIAIWLLGLL